jgi:hypothetical protein
VSTYKLRPSLARETIFLIFVRPNFKVYNIALVPNLNIRNHLEDSVILGQAIKEYLVALVG